MNEQITILTKKTKHGSHHQTKVTINWEGVTQNDLMILARRALIYNFQVGVTKDLIPGVPEIFYINAHDAADDKTPHLTVVFAPKVEKPQEWKDEGPDLESLLAKLSPEELKVLLEDVS
jgi:beta-galactosidase/beta-glucuronidase